MNTMSLRLWTLALAMLVTASAAYGQTTAASGSAADLPRFDGTPRSVGGGAGESVLFYVLGGTMLVSAIGVCLSRSVIRMAAWLFGALGAVALLYFLLGAYFVGAIQLIVYVGGVLILLIFGVMLTSQSPWVRYDVRRVELVAAGGVCAVLFVALTGVLLNATWSARATAVKGATVLQFGKALLTEFLVPFEVASVVLLVVMIAAAYLVRQEQ